MAEVDKSASTRHFLKPFQCFLTDPSITEIAVNRPEEVWVERRGFWEKVHDPLVTFDHMLHLGTAVAAFAGDNLTFDQTRPILSAVLPDGERSQFVMPTACEERTISMTIRKPSFQVRTIDDYIESSFFDRIRPANQLSDADAELMDLFKRMNDSPNASRLRAEFLLRAVELGKNIVIAGATGSGKTTFMKALMQAIPTEQRIITIEDVPELVYGLPKHENKVHLFYPSEGKSDATVTAASLLRSCLRMKPDRILLAELRGGETFDFLNVCMSGHGGSITSCHAGSCSAAFEYLALKVLQSETGSHLPHNVIDRLLRLVIDIVVHVHNDPREGRFITEIYFAPAEKC